MENEKKPSRFGVRLSAIMVAVLLVVCMAVPAFAADNYPSDLPEPPSGYTEFAIYNNSGIIVIYDLRGVSFVESEADHPNWCYLHDASGNRVTRYSYKLVNGAWSERTKFELVGRPQFSNILYSSVEFVKVSDYRWNVVLPPPPPPPPDPMQPFNSGLIIVLDWVGATVSALFSGSLSGLLPLVAVPVAITLLLVAFIVIRRIIWGA